MSAKFLVIDGMNILIRAVEATRNRHMTSPEGPSTAALVVFAQTTSRYVRDLAPYRAVVCWDGGHARRTALHPAYKATRDHAGHAYRLQTRQLAEEYLELSGIPQIRIPGEEADDLIAAYWATATTDVAILSSDKDLLQLTGATPTGHTCTQIRLTSTGPEYWDADRTAHTLGCTPQRIPDLMALTGDPSDNVPGVPRIGPKNALKLLTEADWSMDAVLDSPKVAPHRDQALLSRALVDLRTRPEPELPVPHPGMLQPTRPGDPEWAALADFHSRHGLKDLAARATMGVLWA